MTPFSRFVFSTVAVADEADIIGSIGIATEDAVLGLAA
jgi:hypothetical protein